MIDTHCHLTFPDFAGRVGEVLSRAREHGVEGVVTVSTTPRDAVAALALAREHDRVWCTAGAHPLYADEGPHDWPSLAAVARDARCVAWGELGLDRHYDRPSQAAQRGVLENALALIERAHAEGVRKPVVLHCREAFDELVAILRGARGIEPERLVFHCFTGGPREARLVLDMGAMISFTGVVTYRNAEEVREAARLVPRDRIMVETDAPFLSPEPKRGVRPCEPWMVSLTARRLAEVRGEAWDDFHDAINRNTARFFGIDAR